MKPWRACRPVAANMHQFVEKQDPDPHRSDNSDPDPHYVKEGIHNPSSRPKEKHKNSAKKTELKLRNYKHTVISNYPVTGNNALLSRGGLRGSADCSESTLILLYLT